VDMPAREECGGDVRTPDAPALFEAARDQRLGIDRRAENGEPLGHLANASDPIRTLPFEERAQVGVRRVEEISENVRIPFFLDRGNLDAVDQDQTTRPCGIARFIEAAGGVVIGHAEGRQPRGGDARDQIRGTQRPVGR